MTTAQINSTFAPTTWTMDPPHQPDYLAGAVLNSLGRPLLGYRRKPWGLVKSIILGGLSFGLLPLLMWPRRFREFVTVEQQQLWHLAEWLRVRTGRPEAIALRDVWAQKLTPSRTLANYSMLIVGVLFFSFAYFFNKFGILAATYQFQEYAAYKQNIDATFMWREWNVLLAAGFFFHWLQICGHTAALVDYTRKFNAVTAAEGIAPVAVRGVGLGFAPLWIIAAVVVMQFHAIWALPMALAGVVHSRYVWKTSRPVRSDFADRVRTMLLRYRPALNVPMPVTVFSTQAVRAACANDRCRAVLPTEATYCPRCGMRV